MVWPTRGIADRHAVLTARQTVFEDPRRLAFWPRALPRNANGKIMKSDLKTVFAQEAAA